MSLRLPISTAEVTIFSSGRPGEESCLRAQTELMQMLRVTNQSSAWVAFSCAPLRSVPASTVPARKPRFQCGRAFVVSRGWSTAWGGSVRAPTPCPPALPRGAAWLACLIPNLALPVVHPLQYVRVSLFHFTDRTWGPSQADRLAYPQGLSSISDLEPRFQP